MPRPRADFSCRTCAERQGVPELEYVVHRNLPVDAVRCPYCGHRRGFRRLFNQVQVSTRGRRVARFIDRQMRPAWDQKTAAEARAADLERAQREQFERAWAAASPTEREQAVSAGVVDPATRQPTPLLRPIPATAAMAMVDPAGRQASQSNVPLLRRTIRPNWQG